MFNIGSLELEDLDVEIFFKLLDTLFCWDLKGVRDSRTGLAQVELFNERVRGMSLAQVELFLHLD